MTPVQMALLVLAYVAGGVGVFVLNWLLHRPRRARRHRH
jgi:hypothetical protein